MSRWRYSVAVFVIALVAMPQALPLAYHSDETGRWKVDGNGGCYWDANDDGPDQCDPNSPAPTGRWKWNGDVCYWDGSDSGPDQCGADTPPGEPPVNDGSAPDQEVVTDAFDNYFDDYEPETSQAYWTAVGQLGFFPSCRRLDIRGNVGYIAIQTSPDGYLQWGAFMYASAANVGLWQTWEYVDAVLRGYKFQFRNPHGSFPPSIVHPGALFHLYVSHYYYVWTTGYSREFGVVFTWVPRTAVGSAWCIVP